MDTNAVFNLSEALNRVDGDQELLIFLAGLFVQESTKEVSAARAALGRQDQDGLVAASHKLKGSVLEMCAPRLYESARRLEELGRQGAFTEASAVCTDVDIRLAEVHAALRDLIAGGCPS